MTFEELYKKWERNINAEYIIPTLDKFKENNIIINKFDDKTRDVKLKNIIEECNKLLKDKK
jgi:hypothetical protein